MLQLFFAVAFSAAPLTLYVPPVRSLNLFVHAVQGFARQTVDNSARVYPRARLGISRILAALGRWSKCWAYHTIFNSEGKNKMVALHLVPSGILNEQTICVIGGLFKEIDSFEANGVSCEGRILVYDRAHLLFDFHQEVHGLRDAELAKSFIRTTRRGILITLLVVCCLGCPGCLLMFFVSVVKLFQVEYEVLPGWQFIL